MARFQARIPQDIPFVKSLSKDQQEVLDIVNDRFDIAARELGKAQALLNGYLGLGHPAGDERGVLGSVPPAFDNMQLSWHTEKFTAAAQLGGNATRTIIHNFNIPVFQLTGPGPTQINTPNVRWIVAGAVYGDKTETVVGNNTVANVVPAAPPPGAGGALVTILYVLGDPITRNTIDLRFYSSLVPAAATPLYVDFGLFPAVR